MRLSFLGVVFILQCFGTDRSMGADKLLNEACVAAVDTCVDISGTNPSLVLDCDSYFKRCLIKAEQTCTKYPAFCVSGASCVTATGKCTCGSGFSLDGTNKICTQSANGKAKAACTPADPPPCSADSTCTSGVCTCNDGYNISADGSCAAVGANNIGGSCTTDVADTEGSCSDANAVCSATSNGRCSCKSGYTGTDGGICSITPHKVGGICKVTGAPAKGSCGVNAVCSANTDGVCQCPNGFNGNDGDSECTAISNGKVNAPCIADSQCTGTNVYCKDRFCACKEGFSGNKGDADCTPAPGRIEGSCSEVSCEDSTNAECISNVCKCKNGFKASPGAASCAPAPGRIEGICLEDSCDDTANAECINNVCKCKDGFNAAPGSAKCVKQTEGGASGNVLCSLLLLATTSMAVLLPTVN